MPNHVQNILDFYAEGERLKQILTEIQDDEYGMGSIDFNKIIPMPESLNIESGSKTDKGYKMVLKMLEQLMPIQAVLNNPDSNKAAVEKAEIQKAALQQKYESMSDEEKETFALGKQYYDNIQKYGAGDWYHWSIANWDTKWNAYNFSGDETGVIFQTAWSASHNIIRTISEKYPEVRISHRWADEDLGNNLGEREYLGGEITYENIPNPCSKEAYDMAFEIWEYEPEELGFTLNADGTEYIELPEEDNRLFLPESNEDDEELEE